MESVDEWALGKVRREVQLGSSFHVIVSAVEWAINLVVIASFSEPNWIKPSGYAIVVGSRGQGDQ